MAILVNFVCIVFKQGVKMITLTLSPMKNIIVECNHKCGGGGGGGGEGIIRLHTVC